MLKAKTARNLRAKSVEEPRSRDKYFSRAVSKALEVLEGPQLLCQPGIEEAQGEIYRQAGRYAQLLRPHDAGGDTHAGRG